MCRRKRIWWHTPVIPVHGRWKKEDFDELTAGWDLIAIKSAGKLSKKGNDLEFWKEQNEDAIGQDFRKTGTNWAVNQVLP